MDGALSSSLEFSKVGRLYRCRCLSCGTFVGASASLAVLKIAEQEHRCKPAEMPARTAVEPTATEQKESTAGPGR